MLLGYPVRTRLDRELLQGVVRGNGNNIERFKERKNSKTIPSQDETMDISHDQNFAWPYQQPFMIHQTKKRGIEMQPRRLNMILPMTSNSIDDI